MERPHLLLRFFLRQIRNFQKISSQETITQLLLHQCKRNCVASFKTRRYFREKNLFWTAIRINWEFHRHAGSFAGEVPEGAEGLVEWRNGDLQINKKKKKIQFLN